MKRVFTSTDNTSQLASHKTSTVLGAVRIGCPLKPKKNHGELTNGAALKGVKPHSSVSERDPATLTGLLKYDHLQG